MIELENCLPAHARKHFINLRNVRQERLVQEHQSKLREYGGQMSAHGQVALGTRLAEQWKLAEQLHDEMAVGFVEDALTTCELYDLPLTQSVCECFLSATEEFLKIKYKQAASLRAQGLSQTPIPASTRQQLANAGLQNQLRVMPKVRVMVETARVEDEKRRVAKMNEGGQEGNTYNTQNITVNRGTVNASVTGNVSTLQAKGASRLTLKDVVTFIVSTVLALGSYAIDDPLAVVLVLGIASVAMVLLCVFHEGRVLYRFLAATLFLGIVVFIGWRNLRHVKPTLDGAKAKPTAMVQAPPPSSHGSDVPTQVPLTGNLSGSREANAKKQQAGKQTLQEQQRCEPGSLCNQNSTVNAPQTVNNNFAPPARSLTSDQHDKIVAALKGKQFKVTFGYLIDVPDARQFASKLCLAVKDAMPSTDCNDIWAMASEGSSPSVGFAITYKGEPIPQGTRTSHAPNTPEGAMIDAFVAAGITRGTGHADPKMADGEVLVVVGEVPTH